MRACIALLVLLNSVAAAAACDLQELGVQRLQAFVALKQTSELGLLMRQRVSSYLAASDNYESCARTKGPPAWTFNEITPAPKIAQKASQ